VSSLPSTLSLEYTVHNNLETQNVKIIPRGVLANFELYHKSFEKEREEYDEGTKDNWDSWLLSDGICFLAPSATQKLESRAEPDNNSSEGKPVTLPMKLATRFLNINSGGQMDG
jgi:hypothetical protein